MKILKRFVILLILAGSAYAGWALREPLMTLYQRHFGEEEEGEKTPSPDPVRYRELIAELAEKRTALSQRYSRARTPGEVSQIVLEGQETLEAYLPKLMRCWLGTPWDYNGISETPGSGKIACGYFVSTIMRDAGFKVERIRLAQQPSQRIIGTFLPRSKMTINAGVEYERYVDETKEGGPGIHIVGLDQHVAFLIIPESGGIRFIHSSGAHPYCVVDEDRENAGALQRSSYRVIGNITRDPDIIHGWLIGKEWPTKLPR